MSLFDFGLAAGTREAADPFANRPAAPSQEPSPIEDFGEKIGGARKDLWAARGLALADIMGMNSEERAKHIVKSSIWPKPDYQAIADAGVPRDVVYWIKLVRDSLPSHPFSYHDEDRTRRAQEAYVRTVALIRDEAMAADSLSYVAESATMLQDLELIARDADRGPYSMTERAEDMDLRKLFRLLQRPGNLESKREDKGFLATEREKLLKGVEFHELKGEWEVQDDPHNPGKRIALKLGYGTRYIYPRISVDWDALKDGDVFYSRKGAWGSLGPFPGMEAAEEDAIGQSRTAAELEKEKKQKVRKGQLKPEILENVERTGPEGSTLRGGRHVTGQDMLDDFGFRGGEFGNWLNEAERQANLDMSHDAFHDLALALGIRDEDVSLGGRLAIAYGARGHGKALAHFEPERDVINLTKMKGAGSLAHEWIHAMDDIVGEAVGVKRSSTGRMMSEAPSYCPVPEDDKVPRSFKTLMETIKYRWLEGEEAKAFHAEAFEEHIGKIDRDLHLICTMPADPAPAARTEELIAACVEECRTGEDYTNLVPMKRSTRLTWDKEPSPAYKELMEFQRESAGDRCPQRNVEWYNAQRSKAADMRRHNDSPAAEQDRVRVDTRYYKDAKALDGSFSKMGHGYWSSDCELLARAGAAWIKDRLAAAGIDDGYLTGHADRLTTAIGGEQVSIAPLGEERERIGAAFDAVVDELKELGIVSERDENNRHRARESAEETLSRIDGISTLAAAAAASKPAPGRDR